MNSLKVTVLGCGSSGGVPRIGNDWGLCDPNEPKNRRRRCSILVQRGDTNVLIDTAPDLREQLLSEHIDRLDAVLYSHDHADQVHGIDDLRVVALRNRTRVPIYADTATSDTLRSRFSYCFNQRPGSPYPPILDLQPLDTHLTIGKENNAIDFEILDQEHGVIRSLGFRINKFAYSNDLNDMPEESFLALQDLDVWLVDALRREPHPTHTHLSQTLEWVERLKPKRTILTNMHIDMDYKTLQAELPQGVEPAYDGMAIVI